VFKNDFDFRREDSSTRNNGGPGALENMNPIIYLKNIRTN
jgi:hypothetical protein